MHDEEGEGEYERIVSNNESVGVLFPMLDENLDADYIDRGWPPRGTSKT